MNLKKKLLTALSVIGIVLAGLSPASAEDFYTVSYGELIQSDNYLELKDLVSQNMTTIAQAKDVEITTTYNLLLDESIEIGKNVIKREGSNTLIQYNSAYGLIEAIRVDKTSYISLGYACAQYYLASWTDAFGVGCGGEANNNRVKKYLKQPKLKYVSFRCTRRNESCNPVNEGYLKVLTGQENLTSIAGNLDLYSYANFDFLFASLLEGSDNSFLNYTRTGMSEYIDYSPVFKIPNPTQQGVTEYSFAALTTSQWIGDRAVDVVMSFDSSGKLLKTVFRYENDFSGFKATLDYKIDSGEKITAPLSSEVATKDKFWAANHSINATVELLWMTTKFGVQAKTIAKKAKRTVNLNDLITVVKKNKLAYAKVKGGIKVTKRYQGVAGSACFAVVAGKINGKEC